MEQKLIPIIVVLFVACFMFYVLCFVSFAVSDTIDIGITINPPPCDSDGICDLGEDESSCPSDCGCNSNSICESARSENITNCSADCGCNNNGVCQLERGENVANCPDDCAEKQMPPRWVLEIVLDTVPPNILNLLVQPTFREAVIYWKTNEPALCQFFWGEPPVYKNPSISDTAYAMEHSVFLTNLSTGTAYHFVIKCTDQSDNFSQTLDQTFSTFPWPDVIPPANVLNFEAIAGDGQITLKWQNPPDSDFKAVRIMRSAEFYPSTPDEGMLVYDGKGSSFIDTGLTNGVRYYYTAFAYDIAGNFSSGATVSTIPQKIVPPVVPPPVVPPPPELIPPVVPPPPEVKELTLKDFDFWQEGKKLEITDTGLLKIESEKPLTVSIDYEKVPEVLKTIMVTLKQDENFFSFLLRINKEKTGYLATLMPPEPGDYPFTITVLDYKHQSLKQIPGEIKIPQPEIKPVPVEKVPWYKTPKIWKIILYLIAGAIIFAVIIYLIWKKITKQHQKNN